MNSAANSTVLIVGCGWLGKKLGKHLIQSGYVVYGTTRFKENFSELKELGIRPVKLKLTEHDYSKIKLPEYDTVIISIPPGRGSQRIAYPLVINQFARFLSNRNGQVIMYSSTSTYKGLKKEVKEEDANPDTESENILISAEGALLKYCPGAVILRLCGLYGEDRHPVKYLAGRKNISNGDAPVNLVHSDDIIEATQKIIERDIKGEVFNVCSDCHPAKAKIYSTLAEQLNLEPPEFKSGGKEEKKIISQKIKERIGLNFKHPDPLEFKGKFLETDS